MGRPLSGVIRRKDYYTASDASNSIEAFRSAVFGIFPPLARPPRSLSLHNPIFAP